jgi:copper resistance protein B
MTRSLLLAAASLFALATPAAAQHADHGVQQAPTAKPIVAEPDCAPEHAAMGHCTPKSAPANPHAGHAAPTAQAKPAAADPNCPPEHAAMGHCTPAAAPVADPHAGHNVDQAEQQPDPHAGHAVPSEPVQAPPDPHAAHGTPTSQQPDPHAGHAMPQQPTSDPHAGHAMPGMTATNAPPVAPPPPEAFTGPEHAGTTVWDRDLFLRKREEELIAEHGGYVTWMFLADQLEYRIQDGNDGYKWDLQGWYGGDYDKLWLKSEGEGVFGESPEQAEIQALYSRALDPWFNLQAGIRHDFRPDPERTHLVLGIQGLAPYWFEVDGQLFLSDKGDLTARFEAEYDQRITNKLILQPAIEFNLAAQDVPEIGVGAGLSTAEIGARLRYEFVPEFAPYIGVEYERAFGDTADFRRAAGEDVGGWSLLVGIRAWF